MKIIRYIVSVNMMFCEVFDKIFVPKSLAIDGNRDFIDRIAPSYLKHGLKVYDVGGGKQPFIDTIKKKYLEINVIGVDIDNGELNRAPMSAYNNTICADISKFRGSNDGDLLICQAVLEHVEDIRGAFAGISSLLKKGGVALVFVPSRNAAFARLNLLLPESIKRRLLFGIFPKSKYAQGFPSYYSNCTPREFCAIAKQNKMDCETIHCYYMSSYFKFCFPIYMVWRIWIMCFKLMSPIQASETFIAIFKKR
jgi:ubiquinone/menaquinone biosynthesis C-methylase UbiE